MNIKKIFSNLVSNLQVVKNNKFNLDKLEKMYGSASVLDATFTPGANYSSVSGSVQLIGSTLRIQYYATRSSSLAAANVTNETVFTLKITSDKIANMWNTSFFNGFTGPIASFHTESIAVSGNVWTFNVTLSACGQALSATESVFLMPVQINLDAY